MDATFKGEANFSFAKFLGWTNFHRAQFFGPADFQHAKFAESVSFTDCAFGQSVTFGGARFHDRADFNPITGIDDENSLRNRLEFIPKAEFSQAVFEDEASFRHSMFTKVEFFRTRFDKDADFWSVEIQNEADFHVAIFHQTANFTHIVLHNKAELNFRQTIFKEAVYFDNRDYGEDFVESTLIFSDAIAEQPEKIRFHSIVLRPHWFLNFDCRKVDFTNVHWINSGTTKGVREELKAISEQKWSWGKERVRWDDAHRLLNYTYSQLADNYENTQRYSSASRFRRAALETQTSLRKKFQGLWMQEEFFCAEFFKKVVGHLKIAPFDLAHFLYRHSSYYGESSIRASIVLLVIIVGTAVMLAVPLSTFKDGQHLGLWDSILYSVRLMILQRPEPSPESLFAKTWTTAASIVAPLQLALLALALRRKFMR